MCRMFRICSFHWFQPYSGGKQQVQHCTIVQKSSGGIYSVIFKPSFSALSPVAPGEIWLCQDEANKPEFTNDKLEIHRVLPLIKLHDTTVENFCLHFALNTRGEILRPKGFRGGVPLEYLVSRHSTLRPQVDGDYYCQPSTLVCSWPAPIRQQVYGTIGVNIVRAA